MTITHEISSKLCWKYGFYRHLPLLINWGTWFGIWVMIIWVVITWVMIIWIVILWVMIIWVVIIWVMIIALFWFQHHWWGLIKWNGLWILFELMWPLIHSVCASMFISMCCTCSVWDIWCSSFQLVRTIIEYTGHIFQNTYFISIQFFPGNVDPGDSQTRSLPVPVYTRYIRIHPQSGVPCLRFDILGCRNDSADSNLGNFYCSSNRRTHYYYCSGHCSYRIEVGSFVSVYSCSLTVD